MSDSEQRAAKRRRLESIPAQLARFPPAPVPSLHEVAARGEAWHRMEFVKRVRTLLCYGMDYADDYKGYAKKRDGPYRLYTTCFGTEPTVTDPADVVELLNQSAPNIAVKDARLGNLLSNPICREAATHRKSTTSFRDPLYGTELAGIPSITTSVRVDCAKNADFWLEFDLQWSMDNNMPTMLNGLPGLHVKATVTGGRCGFCPVDKIVFRNVWQPEARAGVVCCQHVAVVDRVELVPSSTENPPPASPEYFDHPSFFLFKPPWKIHLRFQCLMHPAFDLRMIYGVRDLAPL